MRIWSIHPKYLDSKGLVALWRETLLAKHVLEGKTRGYRNHPQLDRFKKAPAPRHLINQYLAKVHEESVNRAYHFNSNKIDRNFEVGFLDVTQGQLEYEWKHLMSKLQVRDADKYHSNAQFDSIDPHPLFRVVPGGVENWEILK